MRRHTKNWNLSLLAMLTILAAATSSFAGPARIKIILVGDSTVTDNAGWGLGFKQFFTDEAECINAHTIGARLPATGCLPVRRCAT